MGGRVLAYCMAVLPLPFWIPAFAGMTRWAAGAYPGSWSGTCFHSNRSCRLSPAHQGMKIGAPVGRSSLRWLGTRVGRWPAWGWGQAPALHFLLTIGCHWRLEPVPESIPDQSPRHAFVPITGEFPRPQTGRKGVAGKSQAKLGHTHMKNARDKSKKPISGIRAVSESLLASLGSRVARCHRPRLSF